ncbi:MAG TPA: ABC transporter ATP-binding protein [Thermomicrobiales bacterium]|nr:ABC transporter ATP-binding protein [Thermomicrobiales bacterium]
MQRHGREMGRMSPEPGSWRALGRAIGYLRRYRLDAAGALLALIVVSASNLAVPQVLRIAIDSGVEQHDGRIVGLAAAGLVGLALVRGLTSFLQGYLSERASQGVAYDLRDALFARIERLSFAYFDRVEVGQLISRITNDVEQIRQFAGAGIIQLASAIIMLLGTTTLLLVINWRLALVALATIPLILIVLLRFVRAVFPIFGQLQRAIGRLNAVLQEDLVGMRVIRIFGQEQREAARYATANAELLDRNVAALHTFGNNFPLVFFTGNLGLLAVVWVGGREVIGGQLTIGELVAFTAYLNFLLFPIMTIGFQMATISRAGVSALRVFDVLDEPDDLVERPDARVLPPIQGRIEFRDVHFRYPGAEQETLAGIDLTIEPGQTAAIIGTTGSGKSSLVSLISRFYDVSSGAVLIDGHDVREVTLSSLRGQVGIVMQETLLFSGTIRDNIAYGRPEATDAEVVEAAQAAQAEEFIATLPDGYDTVVGERGLGLSGGQRQRIAIARALLVYPRILILDDSTSSVDARTEAAIQEALDRLMREGGRTIVVIAQRISTVRNADVIIVLDAGKVVAQGTHDELLEESAIYNEIIQSQLVDDRAAAPAAAGGDR